MFSLYKDKSQKNMSNQIDLKTVKFKERLEYFISSTLERPPTLYKTGDPLMNQYLMTKSVYIRSISKLLESLREEVFKKTQELNVGNKHQNIAARTFLDAVITASNYDKKESDSYIETYEIFVGKSNEDTKSQYDYGMK